jgi:hypothetical protein
MRLFFAAAASLGIVSTLSGCADQVQTGCPPITGNNGVITVYLRQPQGTYAVFISCAGQQYELLTNYSFQSCPSATDQAILSGLIDTMCSGVAGTSSTGVPTIPTTWSSVPTQPSSSSASSSTSESTTVSSDTTSTHSSTTTTESTTTTTTSSETTTTTTESSTTTSSETATSLVTA